MNEMFADVIPTRSDIDGVVDAVSGFAIRTPVVRMASAHGGFSLKLENLQPTGSFKIRGASAAVAQQSSVTGPLVTVSAGNMGRAVAYLAARIGRESVVVVPEHAPAAKLDPIRALGGTVRAVPFAEWWRIVKSGDTPVASGVYVHPFLSRPVMAGNATIALELVEQTDANVVLVPWGGGGLALGIAAGLKLVRPEARVIAVEVATAAPLRAAFDAGRPVSIAYQPTFVDGIGSPEVGAAIWPHVRGLIDDVIVVDPRAAEAALRRAASTAHVLLEGAAACAVAAADDPRLAGERVAVIGSGGNIDLSVAGCILTQAG